MMKLFKYIDYKVEISPEALTLSPFRKIWQRDKSENKKRALSELGLIYFYCDPRSDYQYLVDKKARLEAIKVSESFAANWKPDKVVKEAIELYMSFVPTSALLLQSARIATNNLRNYITNLDLNATDEHKKPLYSLNSFVSALKQMPALVESISQAEKTVNSDMKDNSRMRGQGEKTILEDGFKGFK